MISETMSGSEIKIIIQKKFLKEMGFFKKEKLVMVRGVCENTSKREFSTINLGISYNR
jgi:hypothetical protein